MKIVLGTLLFAMTFISSHADAGCYINIPTSTKANQFIFNSNQWYTDSLDTSSSNNPIRCAQRAYEYQVYLRQYTFDPFANTRLAVDLVVHAMYTSPVNGTPMEYTVVRDSGRIADRYFFKDNAWVYSVSVVVDLLYLPPTQQNAPVPDGAGTVQ